ARDEDLLGKLLRTLGLPRAALVVEHERVQIAVARVEDVADAQAVLALELGDAPQHLGELGARDDAVLDVVALAHAPHRAEGGLAPLPEERPLVNVLCRADLPGAALATDAVELHEVLLDLRRDAVELHDQD